MFVLIALADGVEMWYTEEKQMYLDAGRPAVGAAGWSGTGHYTQLTWTTSNKLGCAFCDDSSGGTVLICNYSVNNLLLLLLLLLLLCMLILYVSWSIDSFFSPSPSCKK